MKHFIKEWGWTILIVVLVLLSRLFIWSSVTVDGHSMDPTLSDRNKLVMVKTTKINRFDIVVAKEQENGKTKRIVKRVIGMPGDTIKYDRDQLYVNGKKTSEHYLNTYIKYFKNDKLQKAYAYNTYFQSLARNSDSFTQDNGGNTRFEIKVPKGQYYLLGDDRIVSKDSRAVGTFSRKNIVGEIKFRWWPFNHIGSIK